MKMLLYKSLTQCIVILGELRKKVEHRMPMVILKGRTFVFGPSGVIECCDCCLTHLNWVPKNGNAQLAQPMRPKDYDYRGRFGAEKPSPFKHEGEIVKEFQDKWRVKT